MSEQTEQERRLADEKIQKLKASKFKQQMLPSWRPIPTYQSTLTIFIVFGVVFLTLGIVLYFMSNQIVTIQMQYNVECQGEDVCILEFDTTEAVEGPVFVYYELGNFYQNHRRYVKSRSYLQLMGEEIDEKQAKLDCDPIIKNKDTDRTLNLVLPEDGGPGELDPEAIAYPCGLIAKSLFTDSYEISTDANFATIENIDSTDIAWKSDVDFKFKNQPGNWRQKQWQDVEDQHFIVWMRTAGLPQFRKLYGKLQEGLQANTRYYVRIQNTYDVSGFSGDKSFVLSTTNALGGQNYFLAIAYMVVGALCLILAMIFLGVCLSKGKDKKANAPAQNN